MADRRMISSKVLKSDDYGDLSFEAQALYPQLVLEADNFGFVTGIKRIMRSMGVNPSVIEELTKAGFLIKFENPYLIRHWFVANFGGEFNKKGKDITTSFTKELMQIRIDQEGAYLIADFDGEPKEHQWYTGGTPNIVQSKVSQYIIKALSVQSNADEGSGSSSSSSSSLLSSSSSREPRAHARDSDDDEEVGKLLRFLYKYKIKLSRPETSQLLDDGFDFDSIFWMIEKTERAEPKDYTSYFRSVWKDKLEHGATVIAAIRHSECDSNFDFDIFNRHLAFWRDEYSKFQ